MIFEAAKLKGRIYFTGYIDDELLKQYFVNADLLVLPSFYEGFGLPPLEAMACGCPVIVSNVASLPEVCGDAALYCDPCSYENIAENILRLINNESLKETLKRKGLEHARKFTWGNCALETCKVITKLLSDF